MVHKKKLFSRSSVKYRTFSEGPREVIYFPYVVKKKWKAAINCPKIVTYTVKIVKFLVLYNFWTSVKSNIRNVWNWNFWTLFGSEIEVRGPWPPAFPSGYAPAFVNIKFRCTTRVEEVSAASPALNKYKKFVLEFSLKDYEILTCEHWEFDQW